LEQQPKGDKMETPLGHWDRLFQPPPNPKGTMVIQPRPHQVSASERRKKKSAETSGPEARTPDWRSPNRWRSRDSYQITGPQIIRCLQTARRPAHGASSPPRQLSSAPGFRISGAATAVGDMEAAVPSRVALSAASRLPNRHAVAGAPSPSLPILAPFCQFVRIWMRFWE